MDLIHPQDGGASVQVIGDEVYFSASSLGSCTKALAAARQGLEQWQGSLPEKTQETFEKGHEKEEVAKKWYRDNGWVVKNEQMVVRLHLTPKLFVVGHIDFTVERPDRPVLFIVDAKRQNDEEFAKQSIQDSMWWYKYEWQFSSYILATDLHMMVCRVSDSNEIKTNFLSGAPKTKTDILARVLQVQMMASKNLRDVDCDKNDYPCPYFRLHPSKEAEKSEIEDVDLASLALHYKRLAVELEPFGTLTKRQKQLKDKIMEKIGSQVGKREITERSSGIVIRVTTSATGQKVIAPGKMSRVTVDLPGDEKESDDD